MDALVSRLRELAAKATGDLLGSIAEIEHPDDMVFLAMLASSWPALLSRIESGERLAEALESFAESKVLRERFDHCGAMNATQLMNRDWYLAKVEAARAALAAYSAAKKGAPDA